MAITLDSLAGPSVSNAPAVPVNSLAPDPAFMTNTLGESPWVMQDNTLAMEETKRRTDALNKIDQVALDPDSFFKDKDMTFAGDPKKSQILALNSAYLEFASGDQPVPLAETDIQRRMIRQEIAIREFGGRGADSEEAFHAEVVNAATQRKNGSELARDLTQTAFNDASLPNTERQGWATYLQTLRSHLGYDRTKEPDYLAAWHEVRQAAGERIAEFKPSLDAVWKSFTSKGDVRLAAENAYYSVPDDQREAFMASLALRARTLPVEEQATFWGNLGKQSGRDIKGFAQSALDGLNAFTAGTAAANAMDSPGTVAQGRMEREALDFQADVSRIQQGSYDPMKYLSPDGSVSQILEKGVYGAPGAVVTSATAAIPGVGLSAFYLSSQESIYQQYRQDFQDKGMSYQEAASLANNLAPIAAVPQVLMEKLQLQAIAGKLPVLESVLGTAMDKISNRFVRFGVRTATTAVQEGMLEKAQDLVPALVQDIGHALSQDVPDVQWTGKGGVLDGFWADSASMVVTMLPLALFGAAGGISSEARVKAFSAASDEQLLAAGITPDDVAGIRSASAKGYNSGAIAIESAFERLDPQSETAKAATETLRQKITTQEKAQAALEKLGYAPPRFVHSVDGVTVFDGITGEPLGDAPDMGGALKIAKAHTGALDNLSADSVAYLGTLMESARAATELDPNSIQDVGIDEHFDPDQASPEMAARFRAQVALQEQAEGGSGDIARSVLGYSDTSFSQGIRTTINKLFAGAAVTDVFHETFHGLRRQALADGAITRADEIALLRGLDTILGGRTTKAGTQLRFIPDGMADADISETLLDEAISQIAEMEILRTRKKDGKGKLGVSRGVISRNLSALANLMPGVAGKWKAFMGAVRARWGLSLSRAIALKKAERDGKFDKEGYDAFLNKLLGLDAQAEHDAAVAKEFDRLLGGFDDVAFSVGDYRIQHQPHPEDATISNLEEMFGADIYGPNAIRYFGAGQDGEREAVAIFKRVKGKPEAPVTIYRVVPDFVEEINPGDWVTISKKAAEFMNTPDFIMVDNQGNPQQPKIISKEVKAGEVRWPGDSLLEQGYFPGGDVAFSISASQISKVEGGVNDAVYLKAVEAGDMATAQKMVDEAAKAAGYTIKAYHGTGPKKFQIFKAQFGRALWFSENRDKISAGESGASGISRIIPVYLKAEKPAGWKEYDNLSEGQLIRDFDSVKLDDDWIIFDPSQIKSAEAVSKVGGRIIPLSERFDSGNAKFAFSIGPATVADILSRDALSRIDDPRRRTQIMSRIARDFNAMRLQIDRISSLSGIRKTKGDLKREAQAREDARAEELIEDIHRRFGSVLADGDLVKIKSQPVHSYLSDPTNPMRGKLMSKARAMKNHPDQYQLHREGHYDGSDGVSRSVFGGDWNPSDAAQNLFDENLISEPTADAMWEALLVEQKTVAGMKEQLAKAQEQIREAKAQAKKEANEWLATQGKDQEVNFNDKEEIRRSLRMLDAILLALPAEIRGKIGGYTQISMINSDKARLEYLADKLEKADKELEIYLRVEYGKEFEELLKKAAPKTNAPGERPSGSIAADIYDIFRVMESVMGLDFAKGEAEADKWDAIADHPDTPEKESDLARVTAQMVRLTMNWNVADAARREQAVLEGEKLYYLGLSGLAREASARRERIQKIRTSAITGTGKTGHRMEREAAKQAASGKLGDLKQMSWEFLSFGQLVNVLFGEQSGAAQWFNARELAASNAAYDGFQAKANALEQLFDSMAGNRFDGQKLRHRMATEQTISATDALGVDHTFSDSQAITFLLMYRQEDGKRHMQGIINEDTGAIVSDWGWDDAAAADIESKLSPEGRAVMAFLGQSYGEEYGRINQVFRRIWNVSMPRHKLYAPLSVNPVQGKGDTIMDPESGDTMGAGMTPGSLKNRSFSAIAEPEFKDAFQVYLTHARQMEHFIAYGEFARDALGVVNRKETRQAIIAAGGPAAAGTLSKWIDYFALGGVHDANMGSAWTSLLGGMLGRISQAALVGRVSVLAMQSLQLAAASFKMPLGSFLTRFAKLTTGQLEWADAIQSEYIQRRLSQMPPVVRDAIQGLSSGTPNRAKYLAGIAGKTISGADALFTAGTYAIFYDYHLKLAKQSGAVDPVAEAHRQAETLTDQVAQPTRTGARSWLEVANAGNPAFRAAWNFSSDPRQKASLLLYEVLRRDMTGKDKTLGVAKTGALLWIVGGVLQTLLRTIIRDLRSSDDDEIFDERYWNPYRLALMASTGPLGAVPFLGGMLEDATFSATGEFMPKGGMLGFLSDAAALPRKWSKGKVEPLKDMETLTTAGAGMSGTSAAAASAMHLIRDVVGVVENFSE